MKNIIIAAFAEAIKFLVGKDPATIEKIGIEHGKWLQANVTDKVPSGETFETIAETLSGPYLKGIEIGVNIKES